MKIESACFEAACGRVDQLPAPDLPEIVFSGKSNVGKSSLINRLLNRKSLARVSSSPGKTATVNFYRLDTCRLVDLPGYGFAKVSKAEKQRWAALVDGYLLSQRPIRLVVQLIDMRHGPSQDDQDMMDFLLQRGLPFLVAATKSDKLNTTQRKDMLAQLSSIFAGTDLTVLPFSATKGEGCEALRQYIADVCEET